MGEFIYENQGANTYLVYEIVDKDQVDSMTLGMLTNNKIPGFVPTFFTQMDSNRYVKYNVSSKVSVNQFFNGPVNKKRLLGVFEGIVDGLLSAEDYMIDINSIVLDLEYIFADVSTCEASLICLPVVTDNSNSVNVTDFFKNIMFSTQFDQTENCDHVAKIINFLNVPNSTSMISLTEFKKLLQEIKNVTTNNTPTIESNPTNQAEEPVVKPIVKTTPSLEQTSKQQPKVPLSNAVSTQTATSFKVPEPPKKDDTKQTIEKKKKEKKISQPEKKETSNDKMSMMHLLRNFSKENLEIYKEQHGKTSEKENEQKEKGKVSNTSFAIPGQEPPKPVQSNKPYADVASNNSSPNPAVNNMPIQPSVPAQSVPQGMPKNFGDTMVLNNVGIGDTTVLSALQDPKTQSTPYLIRNRNNEKIILNKPVFRIGKERSYVDYFIADNTAISRSHANFIVREGSYFVVDTNSTNHTYVNGTMIQSNVETPINDGDRIRLANEDFDFKLF